MIKSMTGYGSSKLSTDGIEISAELKSVNNRYLDVSVRLPRSFIFAEDSIKTLVQNHISRGKVDVFINIDSSGLDDAVVKVNDFLAKGYIDAINHVSDKFSLDSDVSALNLIRFPDVISIEKNDLNSDFILESVCRCFENALTDYDLMREREGEKLKTDILSKLDNIEQLVSQVEEKAPETVEEYRARLLKKMQDVLSQTGIDENRILQEAAIFADHIAVDEETVRLRSHISQMRLMCRNGSPIGRKMDFLIQEFNREANTIGSKCQNSDISYLVVEIKSEIEKIREQIQNIE